VWWIAFRKDGKTIHRSLKTKDKAVAQFRKNEIENEIARGDSPIVKKNLSVWKCFNEFKQYRAGRISEGAQAADHYRIELFLNTGIGSLSGITESKLKEHLDRRIKEGLSNRTANHTIRALNTFLNFCIKQKYIQFNPLKYMPKYPIDKTEPRFLTGDEVKKLLNISKNSKIYYFIAFAVYTGMRWGEIAQLKWEDIDFNENVIRVKKSKSKNFRNIPLHPDLKKIIDPTKGAGLAVSQDSFRWEFDKVVTQAGLPRFRFHDLRHTFASMLIRSGADILTVSKLLGHSTISTTQIYSHLYNEHIVDAVNRLSF